MSNINNQIDEKTLDSHNAYENIGVIANNMMAHLYGLNKPTVDAVIEWIKNSLDSNYYLSNPNDLRNS